MLGTDLRRPLGQRELADLELFLASTPKAMPLAMAHGFLTGIVSAPTTIMTSVWQPVMIGEPAFESMEEARRVLGLVMRLYNQILTDLNEGRKAAPPNAKDDDWLALWCAGYLRAARMDDEWAADEHGVALLFPFAILAREVDLVGEKDSEGKIIEDPTPQLRRCREQLRDTVLELHQYWNAWRKERVAAPAARRTPKVGRNEKCPCGSGLKFKKCCAMKMH
jgi:uncharacterized protein